MSRTPTPHHDNCTLITDSTGKGPLVSKCKCFSTWDHFKYLVHHGQNKMLSTQITLYGYSLFTISPVLSLPTAVVLLLPPPRMIMSSSPSTTTAACSDLSWLKRNLFFELWWCNNCFELHNFILKASLSDVFVMKANNFTSKYGSPPSRPDLSSTIYTMSCSFCPHHRTPQGCHWSQKGSDSVSLWQQLQCDEEQDESLPVEGKGGILQLVFAGKTSTSVLIPRPPDIIRPAQWKI